MICWQRGGGASPGYECVGCGGGKSKSTDSLYRTLSPWVTGCHSHSTGHGISLAFRVTGYHSPYPCSLMQFGAAAGASVGGGGGDSGRGISLRAAGAASAGVDLGASIGALRCRWRQRQRKRWRRRWRCSA
ncbi:hypothetical protein P167DRAFT_550273 [Morchella conica CCBAS932]|uniref:Uncharacterized protein n=1 Tax=Morchella conica CCBAS932 TaxID=1392247 RepID=A0A3N4K8F8_9PEZI|nr:hypothetical protein P167DRAFT_550273 [Morchella conica CCBAS932]